MDLLIVLVGVLILLFLIGKAKLNTFVSLVIVSFIVAMLLGIDLAKIPTSIETGIGGQLGHLGIIFGFGAMLGRLVSDAGGAYRIAHTLIDKFGNKRIQLAVVLASFIIGIALFFEVGMVLLIPIIFAIAAELAIPILYLGIPMVAALSVAHGFLPPHPGPTAIAGVYGANMGLVLLYGFIIAVPTVLIEDLSLQNLRKRWYRMLSQEKAICQQLENIKSSDLKKHPLSCQQRLPHLCQFF